MPSIGRYDILDKLGQGGMGIVYRARDTLLERIVAVKVISTPIEQNGELRERFFREARAAGQLSHKNIITIHDLGEHDGQPYLAMEYLEGEDLLTRMASPQRISLRHRVEIATEICEGLAFAHAHGVVHRDIKPANIFLTDAGVAKILDFGLARLVTSELTRSSMMMGTVNYMAPEQIRGERTDHRSDIFSTAVVLYELLSGRRAFEADSFGATLYKILQEVPEPLQRIDPGLPPELVQIVERGLAKPRDERYQQMNEMVLDLAVYRQQLAAMDSPAAGRKAPLDLRTAPSGPVPVTLVAPAPPPGSGAPPVAPHSLPAGPPAGRLRSAALPSLGIVALVIVFAGIWKTTRSPASDGVVVRPAAETAGPSSADSMTNALAAYQNGDYAAAQRIADALLAHDAGNEAAIRLRDRARASATAVRDGLAKAQALFDNGQFEAAARAAGGVLSIAPANQDAKRLMEEGANRPRGRGAEEARRQDARAKAAAREAGVQTAPQRPVAEPAAGSSTVTAGVIPTATPPAEPLVPAENRQPPHPFTPAPENPEKLQPAAPPPAAPVPPPAAPAAPSAEALAAVRDAAIQDLLGRYAAALESRSLDAVKRLWPGLSSAAQEALRVEFQHATRIGVEILDPRIAGSGDTATVSFVRRYDVITVEGQRLHSESHATMEVRRAGASWVIDRIRFAPRR